MEVERVRGGRRRIEMVELAEAAAGRKQADCPVEP